MQLRLKTKRTHSNLCCCPNERIQIFVAVQTNAFKSLLLSYIMIKQNRSRATGGSRAGLWGGHWTLGALSRTGLWGDHKCLFHVKSFLTLLFAVGNIAVWGHGPPPLDTPPSGAEQQNRINVVLLTQKLL